MSTNKTHHIARQQASCVSSSSSIRPAPENYNPPLILWVPQNIVQSHSKPVKVSDVKWAKVVVECIVQKSIINSKVDGLEAARVHNGALVTLVCSPGNVGGNMLRCCLVRIRDGRRRERRRRRWRRSVRSKIETIFLGHFSKTRRKYFQSGSRTDSATEGSNLPAMYSMTFP